MNKEKESLYSQVCKAIAKCDDDIQIARLYGISEHMVSNTRALLKDRQILAKEPVSSGANVAENKNKQK